MAMNKTVEAIKHDRLEAIRCLRTGEFAYGREHLNKLIPFMQNDFARQVHGHYIASNYIRVADLIEHLWKVVEVPDESMHKG